MLQPTESEFLDLVYGAALEPALWEQVIERFADLVEGSSGLLTRFNLVDGSGAVVTARMGPEVMDRYFAHFHAVNPLNNVPDPQSYMRSWIPRILTDEDWMPKDDLVRSEFYNDFLRNRDVHSMMMVRLAAIGDEVCVLNVSRPQRRGQYERADLERAERLHPHLIRAFQLGRKLEASRGVESGLGHVFDRSPHGLYLLDTAGQVLRTNPAGEALATHGRGLRLLRGRLSAVQPAAARELDGLIAQAARLDAAGRSGGSMAAPTGEGETPLTLTVAPLPSRPATVFGEKAAVIVCVTDPAAGTAPPEAQLRTLFGLTRGEARVALALFEGLSTREVAETLGVSFHTARGQLTQVFAKTGVTKQSELIALMMRSVGLDLG